MAMITANFIDMAFIHRTTDYNVSALYCRKEVANVTTLNKPIPLCFFINSVITKPSKCTVELFTPTLT